MQDQTELARREVEESNYMMAARKSTGITTTVTEMTEDLNRVAIRRQIMEILICQPPTKFNHRHKLRERKRRQRRSSGTNPTQSTRKNSRTILQILSKERSLTVKERSNKWEKCRTLPVLRSGNSESKIWRPWKKQCQLILMMTICLVRTMPRRTMRPFLCAVYRLQTPLETRLSRLWLSTPGSIDSSCSSSW